MIKKDIQRMREVYIEEKEDTEDNQGELRDFIQLLQHKTIIAVAQLANISPEELAEQINNEERFSWYLNQMTKHQLKKSSEEAEQFGEEEIAKELKKLREDLIKKRKKIIEEKH